MVSTTVRGAKRVLILASFPEKILIVDDEIIYLTALEMALKKVGQIQVKACESVDEALSIVEEFEPDLITLDLRMPEKNGVDAVRELRKIESLEETPIVFCTSEKKIGMEDRFETLGILGIIYKPFKPMEFCTDIQQLWMAHKYGKK